MDGQLISIQVSPGGIPKTAVPTARVTGLGLVGDDHHDKEHHGGPDQAVCLYSLELYHALVRDGILVKPGDFGENFTTSGIDFASLEPGVRLTVGDQCELEITRVRTPCYKLGRYDPRLPKAILGRSGWMARVVTEGDVRVGDTIAVDRPPGASGS